MKESTRDFIRRVVKRQPTAKLLDTLDSRYEFCKFHGHKFNSGILHSDMTDAILAELEERNPEHFKAWYARWNADGCPTCPSFYAC